MKENDSDNAVSAGRVLQEINSDRRTRRIWRRLDMAERRRLLERILSTGRNPLIAIDELKYPLLTTI